jgi:toxin CcdB
MARFDVYRVRTGADYLLDCQADVLAELNTRFCVPLMPPGVAPVAGARLNPQLLVGGEPLFMVTQFAAALPVRELGERLTNLADEHLAISNALDMLTTGY